MKNRVLSLSLPSNRHPVAGSLGCGGCFATAPQARTAQVLP